MSRRPADRGHHYGHVQAETLVLIALAGALIFAGIRIALLSFEKICQNTPVTTTSELFILATLAFIVFGVLARYKISMGRQIKSPALVADGYHTLSDSVSAAVILIGSMFVKMG